MSPLSLHSRLWALPVARPGAPVANQGSWARIPVVTTQGKGIHVHAAKVVWDYICLALPLGWCPFGTPPDKGHTYLHSKILKLSGARKNAKEWRS